MLMKLKDSYGKVNEVRINELKGISDSDKKMIEDFIRSSGCSFKEFSRFKVLEDCLIIEATAKDNKNPEMLPSKCEMRIYKNQVDGKICGYAYSDIYIDANGKEDSHLYFQNGYFRPSIAESRLFPQIMKLMDKAETFFELKEKDCRSSYDNRLSMINEMSRPAPELLNECLNAVKMFDKAAKAEGDAINFDGRDITIKSISGQAYIKDANCFYTSVSDFIDDYKRHMNPGKEIEEPVISER